MSVLEEKRACAPRGRVRDAWPVAVVAAAAAALVWCLATLVASVDLTVRTGSGSQPVNVVSVIVTSIVVTLAGAGLLQVLDRRTRRGLAIWTWVALTVLAMSLTGPLAATSPAAGVTLVALHLLVGGVVIVGLRARHPGR